MTTSTFDQARLQKKAIKRDDNLRALARWWSDKYKLPVNHPLLLERTEADLTLELYEDHADSRAELLSMLGDRSLWKDTRRAGWYARLAQLESFLGIRASGTYSDDPEFDAWEQALEEGRPLEGFKTNVHPLIAEKAERAKRGPGAVRAMRPLPVQR